MKINIISIVSAFAACALLVSCYKDMSTEATTTYPDIVIENSGEPIYIGYGQTLEMSPKVTQEGYGTAELTYHWEMDLRPDNKDNRLDLGDKLQIEYVVGNSPSSTPYNLTLTVTNPSLGTSAVSNWKVYVSSSLGEGLLVAHTHDDGVTSQIDLAMGPSITYGYASDGSFQYVRDLYSVANDGAVIEGEIKTMTTRMASNGAVFNEGLVIIGTDEHLLGLSSLDYKLNRSDGDLFYTFSDSKIDVNAVFNYGSYVNAVVVNNILYNNICNIDNMYSVSSYPVVDKAVFHKNNISYASLDQGQVCVFDENVYKFAALRGWQALSGSFVFCNFKGDFDITGAKSLGGGCLNDKRNAFVIRDASGNCHLCIADTDNTPTNITSYDVTLPEVDQAVSFAFCDNSDIFYYATPSKIYATVLSGGMTVTQVLTWSPDSADERITMLQHYRQGWYGTQKLGVDYEFTLPTNRMQIIIVTHNDKTGEGKIYLRGFNVSTGKFTYSSNGTLDGFGRITAVASTLR